MIRLRFLVLSGRQGQLEVLSAMEDQAAILLAVRIHGVEAAAPSKLESYEGWAQRLVTNLAWQCLSSSSSKGSAL